MKEVFTQEMFNNWTDDVEKRVDETNEKKRRAKLWNNMQASVYQSDHKGTRKAPFYNDMKQWYQAYQDSESIKNNIINKYLRIEETQHQYNKGKTK